MNYKERNIFLDLFPIRILNVQLIKLKLYRSGSLTTMIFM